MGIKTSSRPDLRLEVAKEVGVFEVGLKREIAEALKREWPKDTGRSSKAFDVADDLTVTNTAEYANAVEYADKSPHRGTARRAILGALERTITRFNRG